MGIKIMQQSFVFVKLTKFNKHTHTSYLSLTPWRVILQTFFNFTQCIWVSDQSIILMRKSDLQIET